ncbi:Lymphocyte cytosolic protein 2 [Collichthys lucidus]|uniref:Lymphocyte cytosolic protein 2 n=1 Tax=Collichthys lucidus TaxID=240159 RepID=A0A4U5V654_COLLU|nr:Lymphocyte cytosolic protein 2 [Collichthys lucidus]
MSSDRVPSRSEVMGWSPQQLADYLKRMSLSGCDKVVLKNSISGSRFVNLSDNDLQKFPKLHAPLISKISTEISKKEERRGLFSKKTTPKYHEPETTAEVHGWGEDEFDDEEFDDDYESPYSGDEEGSGGDYESPNDDLDGSNDYEPPPSEPPEDMVHKLCPTLPIGDSDYIDNRNNHVSNRGPPPALSPRPPATTLSVPSPRMLLQGRHRSFVATNLVEIQDPTHPLSEGLTATPHRTRPQLDVPDAPTWSKPPALPPASTSINRTNSSARQPPNSKHLMKLLNTTPSLSTIKVYPHGLDFRDPFHAMETVCLPIFPLQDLCLTNCNQDGAYLVRDSTRQLANQPYTLMVFYQDKVYNVQIRQQNQQFLLGTGLKVQETFPSVSGIISHYSQSPLLLIDAKNRSSSQQNQCLLSDPAGYYMTGQTWP